MVLQVHLVTVVLPVTLVYAVLLVSWVLVANPA